MAAPRDCAGAFIVLEGLDGVGKSTAVRLLAKRLSAHETRTPPNVMRPFRAAFDEGERIRRTAYYEVGNFIAGEQARAAREEGKSTVCDRYFCSTHAYNIGRKACVEGGIDKLPPAGDAAWPPWPPMLERPSHMFVLFLPQAARVARLAARVATSEGKEVETAEEKELRENETLGATINAAFERLGCTPVSAEGSELEVVERIVNLLHTAQTTD